MAAAVTTYRVLAACPHCAKQFHPDETLAQTKRNHVVHCAKNPQRLTYRCDVCSLALNDLTAVRRHNASKKHKAAVNPQAAARAVVAAAEAEAEPPAKRYQLILADPPLAYGSKTNKFAAKQYYKTMTYEQLKELDVKALADKRSCALLVWTSGPVLNQTISLCKEWGFKYVTVFVTWVKNAEGRKRGLRVVHGPGNYTRPGSEFLLLARRGKILRLKRGSGANGISQVMVAARREHSRKPDETYALIDKFFDPERTKARLELFARTRRDGWDQALSDEADKF